MPKSHPLYSAEFRAEAIRRVRSNGRSKTAIAQELCVSLEALCAWLRLAHRRFSVSSLRWPHVWHPAARSR
jgi:transposase-like protein